jgi:hypothetical protein
MKPIKKLFISQPMNGITNESILETRRKAAEYISSMYPDNEIVLIDSYYPQENPNYNAVSAVNLLGQALSKMASADLIYFVPGWKDSKGCQVENEVARRWLEPNGVELIEDGMEKIDLDLTDEEIAALEVAANKAGMSMNKFVELKLEESLRDGTFEKVVEEYKKKCS